MDKIITTIVEQNFDGDIEVILPKEIVEKLNIQSNDVLVFELSENCVTMRKRNEFF